MVKLYSLRWHSIHTLGVGRGGGESSMAAEGPKCGEQVWAGCRGRGLKEEKWPEAGGPRMGTGTCGFGPGSLVCL